MAACIVRDSIKMQKYLCTCYFFSSSQKYRFITTSNRLHIIRVPKLHGKLLELDLIFQDMNKSRSFLISSDTHRKLVERSSYYIRHRVSQHSCNTNFLKHKALKKDLQSPFFCIFEDIYNHICLKTVSVDSIYVFAHHLLIVCTLFIHSQWNRKMF